MVLNSTRESWHDEQRESFTRSKSQRQSVDVLFFSLFETHGMLYHIAPNPSSTYAAARCERENSAQHHCCHPSRASDSHKKKTTRTHRTCKVVSRTPSPASLASSLFAFPSCPTSGQNPASRIFEMDYSIGILAPSAGRFSASAGAVAAAGAARVRGS